MTIGEAHEVNALISYVLGRTPYGNVAPPGPVEARESAARLSGRAFGTLLAGWTPTLVRDAWPRDAP